MRRVRSAFFACIVVLAAGGPAAAQDRPDAGVPADPPPTMDVGDLWHKVRRQEFSAPDDTLTPNTRYLVFAPNIGSKPSTGFSGGFSWNTAFFSGDPSTTHISSINGGFKLSQKKQ